MTINYEDMKKRSDTMEKSKVYFIKDISSENVIKAYEALGIELKGNVAVKLHSGEPGNQNFLAPGLHEARRRSRRRNHSGVQHRL